MIKSRDGLDLVSYLTLPARHRPDGDGRPDTPLPMVLDVHGGPWARDRWGFNPTHQLLANRGYAVLSVNYRGSTGFGKKFLNAGNREWAGKMHDDLLDAVDWAVEQKIADRDKVAIMGGSYGGYATLVGLTFTPDSFAAASTSSARRTSSRCSRRSRRTGRRRSQMFDDARRRPPHRGGQEVPRVALAADARRQDREAAADRPGRQRPAREAGRVGPDRQGDAGEEASR